MYSETTTKRELLRLSHLAKQIPSIKNPEERTKAIIDISRQIAEFNAHTDRYKIRYERGEIK